MSILTPARGPRTRDDAGLTLMELLVSMVLLGIIATLSSTWLLSTTKSLRSDNARVNDLRDGQLALHTMTRDLRMAIAPVSGTTAIDPTSSNLAVTFYANVASGIPTRIRYSVQNAPDGRPQLIRETTAGVGVSPTPYTWPSATTKRQVLVQRLDATDGLRLAYTTLADADLPPCPMAAPTVCATPLVASPALVNPGTAGAVQIFLHVVGTPKDDASTRLQIRVRIVNAGQTAVVE